MTHGEKSDLIRELRAEIEWHKALIERLKDKIHGMEKLNQMTDEEALLELKRRLQYLEEALQRQDNSIIELKALLTRAADALAGCTWQERDTLIAELRKAAQ